MKTFEVSFRYQDRKNGSEGSTVKLDASSLSGAIAKATRSFVKGLDRKQRFDMNKTGLEIKAVCITSDGEAKEGEIEKAASQVGDVAGGTLASNRSSNCEAPLAYFSCEEINKPGY